MNRWVTEYEEKGILEESKFHREKTKYSEEQINLAVNYCVQIGMNITQTCRDLGYPCRPVLSRWLDERVPDRKKPVLKGFTLKKFSYNDKVVASIRLICREGSAEVVAKDTGTSRSSLFKWKK